MTLTLGKTILRMGLNVCMNSSSPKLGGGDARRRGNKTPRGKNLYIPVFKAPLLIKKIIKFTKCHKENGVIGLLIFLKYRSGRICSPHCADVVQPNLIFVFAHPGCVMFAEVHSQVQTAPTH